MPASNAALNNSASCLSFLTRNSNVSRPITPAVSCPAASPAPLTQLRGLLTAERAAQEVAPTQCSSLVPGRGEFRYVETRPSLWQAGHLTILGSSSSNHERPHSQRTLYNCCTVTVP